MLSRRQLLQMVPGSLMLPFITSCDQPESELVTRSPILPYVQNRTTNSITILWQSSDRIQGLVQIFDNNDNLVKEVKTVKETFHKVTITELEANSIYHYQIKENNVRVAPISSFRTAPLGGSTDSFSFMVLGDSGFGTSPQFEVANQMLALGNHSAFVIHTGDVIYDGYENQYQSKFFDPYRALLPRIPFYPVKGDHDRPDGDDSAYNKFFALPTNNFDNTNNYYSFSYGNTLVVALDADGILGGSTRSNQESFLVQELSNSTHTWKILNLHHSIHTTAKGRDRKPTTQAVVHPIAVEYGVDIIFAGDVHAYERFFPEYDVVPNAKDGITYITTGGGGAELRELNGSSDGESIGNSEYHFVLVTVEDQTLTGDAYDFKGGVIDTFKLTAS